MDLNVTCPACGAVLSLRETTRRISCDFCGNNFDVDPTQTEPALKRITPEEMIADPIPVQSAATESIIPEPEPPSIEAFPPPMIPQPRIEPMPAYQTPEQPKRNWTWIIVAIIVMVVACGGCSLLALVRLAQGM